MTWALKVAVGAKRPDGGPYSFPSGHTATAFAAAPIVARRLGPVAGCAAYALAGLTGLARIEDRRHHVEDVLVGAAIGIIAGRSFSDLGAFKFAVPKRGIGLGLSVRF
jgi:membrane-associated phospholipid phosphatase